MKPSGDYFTSPYYGMWDRDLPLLAASGVRTIIHNFISSSLSLYLLIFRH